MLCHLQCTNRLLHLPGDRGTDAGWCSREKPPATNRTGWQISLKLGGAVPPPRHCPPISNSRTKQLRRTWQVPVKQHGDGLGAWDSSVLRAGGVAGLRAQRAPPTSHPSSSTASAGSHALGLPGKVAAQDIPIPGTLCADVHPSPPDVVDGHAGGTGLDDIQPVVQAAPARLQPTFSSTTSLQLNFHFSCGLDKVSPATVGGLAGSPRVTVGTEALL